MTQTVSGTPGAPAAPARLLELLERGELDWDDLRHREAYLKAWVNRALPENKTGEARGAG